MSPANTNPVSETELEAMLTGMFGPPPASDIEAWHNRYPAAMGWLDPRRYHAAAMRRTRARRMLTVAAATAIAACVWLGSGMLRCTITGPGGSAFAETIAQIHQASAITWTTTVYVREMSKDGKRHWYRTTVFQEAYKSPGLYRETTVDENGDLCVTITDAVKKKVLTLDPRNKLATIAEVANPHRDLEGPFLDARRTLSSAYSLQFVEKQTTGHGEINVFRRVEGECFFDYWIDQKTKRLVEYRINQGGYVTLKDYENDPMRSAKPEKECGGGHIVGSIANNIDYDAQLDDSLFRFDVPAGYTIRTQRRHYVTEQEVIASMRTLAGVNGGMFPAQIADVPSEWLNKYRSMRKPDRTPHEQKLLDMVDHYEDVGLGTLPLRTFLQHNGDWKTFRYFGKGVKLGDGSAIVCWYKLKAAKDPSMYRVVYGDLSVKDVPAKDLPLPVGGRD